MFLFSPRAKKQKPPVFRISLRHFFHTARLPLLRIFPVKTQVTRRGFTNTQRNY